MVLHGLYSWSCLQPRSVRHPDIIQAWYANDSVLQGKTLGITAAMTLLQHLGPERGYFPPKSAKSIFISVDADQEAAEQHLKAFSFKYCNGHQYVGGFLGEKAALQQWLTSQMQQWVQGVESRLAKVARRNPQRTAYAGLAMSLQQELPIPACSESSRTRCGFCASGGSHSLGLPRPALLQGSAEDTCREVMALSIQQTGLGLPDPTPMVVACFEASMASVRRS
jgi:hypothetical protein